MKGESGEKRIFGGFCCRRRAGVKKNIASFGGLNLMGAKQVLRRVSGKQGQTAKSRGERVDEEKEKDDWMN